MARQKWQEKGWEVEMNDAWGFGRKMVCCVITAVLLGGCVSTQVPAMRESMKYACIPAGTVFHARLEKGENATLVEMKLDRDVMVVDKGYLIKLQKDANRNALGIPD